MQPKPFIYKSAGVINSNDNEMFHMAKSIFISTNDSIVGCDDATTNKKKKLLTWNWKMIIAMFSNAFSQSDLFLLDV